MPTSETCLNCGSPLVEDKNYCPECGQSRREITLSFWRLVREYFASVLNLDGKLFQSLRHLFVPAMLAEEFVKGRRVSYVHPGRLFTFVLIICVASLAYLYSLGASQIPNDQYARNSERFILSQAYDTLIYQNIADIDTTVVDTLRRDLFGTEIADGKMRMMRGNISLLHGVLGDYEVSQKDLATMDVEEIIEKYEITSFWDKIRVRQSFRINDDLRGMLRYLIGQVFWVTIIMVFISSILLKLFYVRHQIYLTEHLVLSTYIHIVNLVLITIYALAMALMIQGVGNDEYMGYNNLILIPMGIFMYLSMKRYYRQGWLKTLIKFSGIGFIYFILAMAIFLGFGLVSLIFF